MPLSSSHGMGTSGMVWWLNIGVYNIDVCTGASYPGFLYSQWREIDTCQVLVVSSCSRGGYIQPRSACSSPLLNKDYLESHVRCRHLIWKNSHPLWQCPCGLRAVLLFPCHPLPIEKASWYTTKKSLRQGSWSKTCLQGVTQWEKCNTGTSKWVNTSSCV